MAHAQKPDFVFRRNGRVHLNRQGIQFSRLLAAEVCASAVVMLDTSCSEAVWRALATHSIRQFLLHFPSLRHRVPSYFNWTLPEDYEIWGTYICFSDVACLLGFWVRIPPWVWKFVCRECCVLTGRGLCDELITRPEESYRLWCVVVCDQVTSWMRGPWPTGGRGGAVAQKRQTKYLFYWRFKCSETLRRADW